MSAFTRLRLLGAGLGGLLLIGGCAGVVTGVAWDYDDLYDPYHYRFWNPDGLLVVYDAGFGLYAVIGRPGLYWSHGHYYRQSGRYWERSRHDRGPWSELAHGPPRVASPPPPHARPAAPPPRIEARPRGPMPHREDDAWRSSSGPSDGYRAHPSPGDGRPLPGRNRGASPVNPGAARGAHEAAPRRPGVSRPETDRNGRQYPNHRRRPGEGPPADARPQPSEGTDGFGVDKRNTGGPPGRPPRGWVHPPLPHADQDPTPSRSTRALPGADPDRSADQPMAGSPG